MSYENDDEIDAEAFYKPRKPNGSSGNQHSPEPDDSADGDENSSPGAASTGPATQGPDPLTAAGQKEMLRLRVAQFPMSEVLNYLRNQANLDSDEIEVLYPTEAAKREAVLTFALTTEAFSKRLKDIGKPLHEAEDAEVDDYELPAQYMPEATETLGATEQFQAAVRESLSKVSVTPEDLESGCVEPVPKED